MLVVLKTSPWVLAELTNASHWRRVHLLWFYCKCLHSSMPRCYQLIVFGTDWEVLWAGLLVVVVLGTGVGGFARGDKVNVKLRSLQTKVLTRWANSFLSRALSIAWANALAPFSVKFSLTLRPLTCKLDCLLGGRLRPTCVWRCVSKAFIGCMCLARS